MKRARPKDPLEVWCQARLFGCQGRAVHRHHVVRRAHGGSDDTSNTKDLCDWCHRHIHANPEWSCENGWMKRGVR